MSSTTVLESLSTSEPVNHKLTSPPSIKPSAINTFVNYWRGSADGASWAGEQGRDLTFHERKLAYRQRSSEIVDRREIVVNDIRTTEEEIKLDTQGFQLCKLESKNEDWTSDEAIKKVYYPEAETLLKEVTSAKHIHTYDHVVRYKSYEASLAAPADDSTVDIPGPSRQVHIDDTAKNAHRMIRDFLSVKEADGREKRPFLIVNTWRPLKQIRRDPLGVIDTRTLAKEDRVVIPLPAGDTLGGDYEVFQIRSNPAHRWYSANGQRPDEALLLKIFDSRDEEGYMGAAHTSFVDPAMENVAEDRQSIELRALCFF